MNAIFHLGTTARGLIATAITGNAAVLVTAVNHTVGWTAYLCASITTLAMLAGAIVDPGKTPSV